MAVTHLPSSALAPQAAVLLRAALTRMRQVVGLPVLFGGTVSVPGGAVRLTELTGVRTDVLRGLAIHTRNGLGGRVLLTARPGSVEDYVTDSRISHEYDRPVVVEGLRAIAAVPVVVGETVYGLLYGGVREPLPLGTRVLDGMGLIAARLGVELAVRAEVERRVAALETAAITRAARERPAGPEWEHLREAHAELRSIAQEIADPALRERLQDVCDRLTAPQGPPGPPNPLSPRELDVLSLVAVGCGNAEVGRRLDLKPETVKSYLRSAMRKLGTHTRMESVVSARRAGYLP
ncbi:LuxR C-terminal-related transcriptional regulator [Nonomuraea spiralis]|uniref:helix-turn-helix domain-containing protein n=1 Tax=Nonomuraea TaxID=83681 RepID=UPI000F7B76CD|nr:helix-turn-helix domain-containing protein [Nonomuraea sp. WAC 01424]RSN02015.1 helix-turn-helix transcriptional regulator [Nonomuraea sp. WAC 01424]